MRIAVGHLRVGMILESGHRVDLREPRAGRSGYSFLLFSPENVSAPPVHVADDLDTADHRYGYRCYPDDALVEVQP